MNLDEYFIGAVLHTEGRAREMLGSIPGNLPRDYDALVETIRRKIQQSLADLQNLRQPSLQSPANTAVRLRRLKRETDTLGTIEKFALPALARAEKPDNRMNQLVHAVKGETGFPFVAPIVSPFTTDYFQAHLELKIILVPLLESTSVLHLPDLYHELAHFLIAGADDPQLAPLQEALSDNVFDVEEHYRNAEQEAKRGFTPEAEASLYPLFSASWLKYWLPEFYCDIFAAACAGPAYGWANLLLNLKHSHNPYDTPQLRPTQHPPEHARMMVILQTLSSLGHGPAVQRMTTLWDDFISRQSHRREAEYDTAVSDNLLDLTAKHALRGFQGAGCRFSAPDRLPPVARQMNEAWELFLADPTSFALHERELTRQLFASCS